MKKATLGILMIGSVALGRDLNITGNVLVLHDTNTSAGPVKKVDPNILKLSDLNLMGQVIKKLNTKINKLDKELQDLKAKNDVLETEAKGCGGVASQELIKGMALGTTNSVTKEIHLQTSKDPIESEGNTSLQGTDVQYLPANPAIIKAISNGKFKSVFGKDFQAIGKVKVMSNYRISPWGKIKRILRPTTMLKIEECDKRVGGVVWCRSKDFGGGYISSKLITWKFDTQKTAMQ